METVVIEARNKSDARFLRNFSKRIGARVIEPDELADIAMCRLMEADLLDPDVSESDNTPLPVPVDELVSLEDFKAYMEELAHERLGLKLTL